MESGTPGVKATEDGWLNRALQSMPGRQTRRRFAPWPWARICRSLCAARAPAIALAGREAVPSVRAVADGGRRLRGALRTDGGPGAARHRHGNVRSDRHAAQGRSRRSSSRKTARMYPNSRVGQTLHASRATAQSRHRARSHASSIPAAGTTTSTKAARKASWRICCAIWASRSRRSHQDMGDRMEDIVVVTMSEFGRTAHENGNRGTDHGHANCMFVMGGADQGRQSLRQMAGHRPRATQRRPRPCADHRFSLRAWRSDRQASRQPRPDDGLSRLRERSAASSSA